jgi:dihydroflavonol-4-reductase
LDLGKKLHGKGIKRLVMVLVTGGTGLVGSHLLYDLLNKGYTVKALIRNTSNYTSIRHTFACYSPKALELFDKIIWVEGDITNLFSLEDAFADVDQVYHTAALVSFNPNDKKKIYNTNVEGTSNIVNLCLEKKIHKLGFVSSISALGTTEDGSPITENNLWKPSRYLSAYSKSKFKAEMEVWRGITEGLNAVIINPSIILGPTNNYKNGSSSFFSVVDEGMPFYTSGTNGYIDVKDVSKIMIELMESDISGERFILSAENIDYRSFFELVADALHVKQPSRYLAPWMAEIIWRLEFVRALFLRVPPKFTKSLSLNAYQKMTFSSEKIKSTLHVNFIPIEKTIKELALFYQTASKSN